MTDRRWTSRSPKLEYSLAARQEFLGVKVPAPPLLLSRLSCEWLFNPHFGAKYATRLESNMMVKPLQQDHNSRSVSSRSTEKYRAWYTQHISDDLRLKFLAPLSTDQLRRITAPLENLVYDPSLQKLEVSMDSFNPLLESLKSSPLDAARHPIMDETELQLAVFPIFRSIVNIVGTLFTRSYIKAPAGNLEACLTFHARHNTSTRHDAIGFDNVFLLRTSTKPQTKITADYYVHINYDRGTNALYDDKGTLYSLQDSLLHPRNLVTLVAEFETELHFEVPTSKIAYPHVMCHVFHASQDRDAKYHVNDFKVFPEGSPKLADFRTDRLGVLDEILGTDQSQGAQEVELPNANTSYPIEQLWTQMVSHGAYLGMLMNWRNRNHLCIRDPRTGTLYISESLNNRLVGTSFGDRFASLNSFTEAMDKDDFPWSDQFDTSLMFVIGGAILTGFRLLHPNLPENPFIPMSQLNGESWKASAHEWEEHRRKRQEQARARSLEELSIHLSNHPSNTRAKDGQGPSYSVFPSQCKDSTSQDRESTNSDTAGNSQDLYHGCTSQSIQKQRIHGIHALEKLYLGIFDGDLYHSEKLEVFYNCDSCINGPNTHHSKSWVPIVFLNHFVGKGAIGDVWQGYVTFPDQASPVSIAAKLAFTPQGIDSLDHEHNIYQFLGNDPNLPIPQMYGFYKSIPDEVGQQVGLLLLSWVEGVMPLYEEEVQQYMPLIIDALEKLHRRGVVHGDIAPRNILINDGKVTLIDFDQAGINNASPEEDMNQLEDMIGSM